MFLDINSIVEGRYYPGTFILGINKSFFDGMQYGSFSTEEMATFVHEYIHYLQDISMIPGLISFQHRAKLLQLNIAMAQQKEIVQIPIKLDTCGVNNVFAQTELISFYEGDRIEKKIHHINKVEIEKEDLIDEILDDYSNYSGNRIPRVSIYYDDEENPITFGTHYIIESMAYLVEHNCFGAKGRVNEFPYNACEMVCDILFPDMLNKSENLVTLCEFSLMYEHGGYIFVNILKRLKQTNIDFLNPRNLMQYLDTMMNDLVKKLEVGYEHICECVDLMFPPKVPFMQCPNMYIKTMFESGYKWRKYHHFFITEIFSDSNPVNIIKTWMDIFPVPLFIDEINKDILGVMEELSIIPVPLSILEYFSNPQNGCPLIDYCLYSGVDNYSKHICKNTPWLQSKKEEKCPLALYFTAYRLDGKKFEII